MVLTDTIHVMLLTHDKFAQFTPKRIADAQATSEVLICISADSREAVDAITDKALAAGGREPREKQDYGFMYGRSFEDPRRPYLGADVDGHGGRHRRDAPEPHRQRPAAPSLARRRRTRRRCVMTTATLADPAIACRHRAAASPAPAGR